MKESVKNVLMPLLQPETSFFELTRSVHINTCSDEIPELAFDVLVPRADVAAGDNALFLIVPVNASVRFARRLWKVRTTERCGFGDKTACVEGVPGWRSSCVLVEGQGSQHATWTCSLAWASSSAGAVSWIKERVGCVQTSIAQGVTGTVANSHNHREGGG